MAKKLLILIVAVVIAAAVLCCWGSRTDEGWATNPDVSTWFPDWRDDIGADNDEADNKKNEQGGTEHVHTFDTTKWVSNTVNHYHSSTCGHNVVCDAAPHTYKDGVCTVCGYKQPEEAHEHTFDLENWRSDENNHWHVSTCEHYIVKDMAAHTYENGVCTVCGYGQANNLHKHTYENGVCTICGYKQPEEGHVHTIDTTTWLGDSQSHWHGATCGHDIQANASPHTFANGVCTVCGYRQINNLHKHTYENGVCTVCGKSE